VAASRPRHKSLSLWCEMSSSVEPRCTWETGRPVHHVHVHVHGSTERNRDVKHEHVIIQHCIVSDLKLYLVWMRRGHRSELLDRLLQMGFAEELQSYCSLNNVGYFPTDILRLRNNDGLSQCASRKTIDRSM
jgi:hypothetical protein